MSEEKPVVGSVTDPVEVINEDDVLKSDVEMSDTKDDVAADDKASADAALLDDVIMEAFITDEKSDATTNGVGEEHKASDADAKSPEKKAEPKVKEVKEDPNTSTLLILRAPEPGEEFMVKIVGLRIADIFNRTLYPHLLFAKRYTLDVESVGEQAGSTATLKLFFASAAHADLTLKRLVNFKIENRHLLVIGAYDAELETNIVEQNPKAGLGSFNFKDNTFEKGKHATIKFKGLPRTTKGTHERDNLLQDIRDIFRRLPFPITVDQSNFTINGDWTDLHHHCVQLPTPDMAAYAHACLSDARDNLKLRRSGAVVDTEMLRLGGHDKEARAEEHAMIEFVHECRKLATEKKGAKFAPKKVRGSLKEEIAKKADEIAAAGGYIDPFKGDPEDAARAIIADRKNQNQARKIKRDRGGKGPFDRDPRRGGGGGGGASFASARRPKFGDRPRPGDHSRWPGAGRPRGYGPNPNVPVWAGSPPFGGGGGPGGFGPSGGFDNFGPQGRAGGGGGVDDGYGFYSGAGEQYGRSAVERRNESERAFMERLKLQLQQQQARAAAIDESLAAARMGGGAYTGITANFAGGGGRQFERGGGFDEGLLGAGPTRGFGGGGGGQLPFGISDSQARNFERAFATSSFDQQRANPFDRSGRLNPMDRVQYGMPAGGGGIGASGFPTMGTRRY